jgi:hypothetical protein
MKRHKKNGGYMQGMHQVCDKFIEYMKENTQDVVAVYKKTDPTGDERAMRIGSLISRTLGEIGGAGAIYLTCTATGLLLSAPATAILSASAAITLTCYSYDAFKVGRHFRDILATIRQAPGAAFADRLAFALKILNPTNVGTSSPSKGLDNALYTYLTKDTIFLDPMRQLLSKTEKPQHAHVQ